MQRLRQNGKQCRRLPGRSTPIAAAAAAATAATMRCFNPPSCAPAARTLVPRCNIPTLEHPSPHRDLSTFARAACRNAEPLPIPLSPPPPRWGRPAAAPRPCPACLRQQQRDSAAQCTAACSHHTLWTQSPVPADAPTAKKQHAASLYPRLRQLAPPPPCPAPSRCTLARFCSPPGIPPAPPPPPCWYMRAKTGEACSSSSFRLASNSSSSASCRQQWGRGAAAQQGGEFTVTFLAALSISPSFNRPRPPYACPPFSQQKKQLPFLQPTWLWSSQSMVSSTAFCSRSLSPASSLPPTAGSASVFFTE